MESCFRFLYTCSYEISYCCVYFEHLQALNNPREGYTIECFLVMNLHRESSVACWLSIRVRFTEGSGFENHLSLGFFQVPSGLICNTLSLILINVYHFLTFVVGWPHRSHKYRQLYFKEASM